jgi:hypothetical protein
VMYSLLRRKAPAPEPSDNAEWAVEEARNGEPVHTANTELPVVS